MIDLDSEREEINDAYSLIAAELAKLITAAAEDDQRGSAVLEVKSYHTEANRWLGEQDVDVYRCAWCGHQWAD